MLINKGKKVIKFQQIIYGVAQHVNIFIMENCQSTLVSVEKKQSLKMICFSFHIHVKKYVKKRKDRIVRIHARYNAIQDLAHHVNMEELKLLVIVINLENLLNALPQKKSLHVIKFVIRSYLVVSIFVKRNVMQEIVINVK